jgi:DNA-directed RNA polymerase beta' subunit
MKNERRKLKQQIEDSEATLQQLLLRRSDLLQQWIDIEEKASEAIFQEMKNIEELERLERTRQAAAPIAELEIPAEDSGCQDILQMGSRAGDFVDGSLGNFLD